MPTREHKSRMRIVRALEKLMQTTPIERVQVTRLCEEADIGRTTFYDNFDNVFSVALWYWDRIIEDTLCQIGQGISFYEAHLQTFQRLHDERDFFERAFRTSAYESINQYGYRHIGALYRQRASQLLCRTLTPEEEAAIHFYNVGASDYCAEWVRTGMQESPTLMAQTFTNAAPPVMDCLK